MLVDGQPVLPAEKIPTLIDPRSSKGSPRFRPTLGALVTDLLRGRVSEADIEAEAVAQIRRLQRLDIQVTHVDTHKHTHALSASAATLAAGGGAVQCGTASATPSSRNGALPRTPRRAQTPIAGARAEYTAGLFSGGDRAHRHGHDRWFAGRCWRRAD